MEAIVYSTSNLKPKTSSVKTSALLAPGIKANPAAVVVTIALAARRKSTRLAGASVSAAGVAAGHRDGGRFACGAMNA